MYQSCMGLEFIKPSFSLQLVIPHQDNFAHRDLAVGGVTPLRIELALGSVKPRPLGQGHAPHYH